MGASLDAETRGRAFEYQAVRHTPPYYEFDSYEWCLADAYLKLGRYDEAIAEYERILRLNPNYPLIHYDLGMAYEGKREANRARSEYQEFLRVWKDADADIPEVIAAKKRLAS